MVVKPHKHDMDELNIAPANKVVARNNVPTIVSVMAFATFANVNGGLDLKTFARAMICPWIDKVRISLVVVMFVG